MSQQTETQTGQAGRSEAQGASAGPSKLPGATRSSEWVEPHAVIQESIKYRRRAQEAERRVEALEAEIEELRGGHAQRAVSLESELAAAKAETEAMRAQLATVERDRRLEREFTKAGCTDLETALALAHDRLAAQASAEGPADAVSAEDPAGFVRGLLDEKPHLRGTSGAKAPAPRPAEALPPKTAGAKTPGASAPQRTVERLAEQARKGDPRDLMAYMRARRGRA